VRSVSASDQGWVQVPADHVTDTQWQQMRVPVTFALRPSVQSLRQLRTLANSVSTPFSPRYGRYLTLEQLHERVEVEQWKKTALQHFLCSDALSDCSQMTLHSRLEFSASHDLAHILLTASEARGMFACPFHPYRQDEEAVLRAEPSSCSIPAELYRAIDFVAGLYEFPRRLRTRSARSVAGIALAPLSTPLTIAQAYNITDVGTRPENVQSVVSFIDQYVSFTDLRFFQATYSPLPFQNVSRLIGPNQADHPGPEANMDVQYLMGVAQNVSTWIWSVAGRTDNHAPFLKWLREVDRTAVIPSVFSVSYADPELIIHPDYGRRVCDELMKLTLRGVTVLAATGDAGVACPSQTLCSQFQPYFPASCPYVTAVGAVQWTNERPTPEPTASKSVQFSGGGFSNWFVRPAYQDAVVEAYLNTNPTPAPSFFNASGRAYPDLSAVGVQFQVVLNGTFGSHGGTSASTPVVAAVVSLVVCQPWSISIRSCIWSPSRTAHSSMWWAAAATATAAARRVFRVCPASIPILASAHRTTLS